MELAFDHLVIGAADLAQGAAWAEETFGAPLGPGGEHLGLATHNALARMPHGYLEILAPDPAQEGPPRWMGLEQPALQAQLRERPKPIAWALSAPDLEAAARSASWDIGLLLEASRNDLSWRVALPPSGAPAEGVLPFLIEWPENLKRRPPVDRMRPLGPPGGEMALGALRLKHPEPDRIEKLLTAIDAPRIAAEAGFSLEFHRADAAALEAVFRPEHVSRNL